MNSDNIEIVEEVKLCDGKGENERDGEDKDEIK